MCQRDFYRSSVFPMWPILHLRGLSPHSGFRPLETSGEISSHPAQSITDLALCITILLLCNNDRSSLIWPPTHQFARLTYSFYKTYTNRILDIQEFMQALVSRLLNCIYIKSGVFVPKAVYVCHCNYVI